MLSFRKIATSATYKISGLPSPHHMRLHSPPPIQVDHKTAILTAKGALDEASSAIWDAYECGLDLPVRSGYKEVCIVANLITSLVTEMEIAICCGHGLDILPGLLPHLRSLEAIVIGYSSLL
jgi:hypothetical protein